MSYRTSATCAAFVVLLLMLSFNTSSVVGEASSLVQQPSQARRVKKKAGPKNMRVDYSQFSHSTHVDKEKPACDGCHKVPTANWKEVRKEDDAFPDVAEFPEHETCIDCHRRQFFARERPAPAICSNCHVNVTPRDTTRFLFPSLGDVSSTQPKRNAATEFGINFPRDKHDEDVKISPKSHTACFSCHNVEAEIAPAPSDCHVCHKFELRPSVSSQHHAGGRKVNAAQQQMKVPDNADYSKFQHSSAYHARLPCLLCHRRDSNAARPSMPGGKDHSPCAGCHVKQFADSSSAICTNCHNDPPAATLKLFPRLSSFNAIFDHSRHAGTACANCHRPVRGGVRLTIPAGFNAHVKCFQCHGPQAKAGDRDISSCGVCHQAGRHVRTSQMARAFRVGFSHDKHNRNEGLSCNDCHRVQKEAVTAPQPLNHHATARSFSCMNCHNGKRAFGGDDFSVCKRCHTGPAWRF
jgi:c(7)-type cytochrome triheme protein